MTLMPSSALAPLAIDSSGKIIWLTPGGIRWLDEFLQKHALTANNEAGLPLPKPILEWVRQCLEVAGKSEGEAFESYRGVVHVQ
jgi:hypothetical protein